VSLPQLLQWLSTLFPTFILGAAVLHLAAFLVLAAWSRRDLRVISSTLDDFTRGLPHRSVLDRTAHVSDQIEAFIADVNETLSNPARASERAMLLQRTNLFDEKRRYLHSLYFETVYNVCRTMIDAYPLMGILGTILGIGSALRGERAAGAAATASDIVARFGDGIWSTFTGLSAAIVLMFLNSLLEPRFLRLIEHRLHVRELIARAKRELALAEGGSK
jgi:biopolymer transport protein ExbB/TolQ